ncbi:hypothetical protein RB614_14245 [Phytohabitans sp. ZYX-F-186]|uniref:Uncharacterized protein n=1 Tax=Phytohabitans maris TaxID=3071409 RepID=A0ABU0ZHC0_9ACTN|nr:hypothetical protein [Phytohabitans sp. ZYX-F-186]MDQ7905675.1 hypothetical protein [Phytohabitans sp. ZYX-F-186]
MTLAISNPDLYHTVVGEWHRRLSTTGSTKRSHWRTKVIYFRSVARLLATHPGVRLTWRRIVEMAGPDGSRSTFYEVAGAHARHPLIDAFIQDGRLDSIQLALCYRRPDAVTQLVDETKVWSFWPYRERLLAAFAAEPVPAEAMEAALSEALTIWAGRNPGLAAALDHAPPACAVEDLMIIKGRQVAAFRATNELSAIIRRAT